MNFLKHTLRIVLSIAVGYSTIQFFHIKDFMLKTFYYFALYIAVSLSLEIIFKYISDKKKKNKR